MEKSVAVLVLNYNDPYTTIDYLNMIKEYKYIKYILVVDNCSTDESYSQIYQYANDKIKIIKTDHNGGYGYGNNFGLNYISDYLKVSHVLITNPDVKYKEEDVRCLANAFDDKTAVASLMMKNARGEDELGCVWKVPSKNDYIFSSLLVLSKIFHFYRYKKSEIITSQGKVYVDCVAGSMLMVDLEKMIKYGMYDENIFLYGEETTLGCKLKKHGLKTVFLPNRSFLHLHGESTKKTIKTTSKRWKMMLNSRYYILKNYLGANYFYLLVARIVYAISFFEIWIKSGVERLVKR